MSSIPVINSTTPMMSSHNNNNNNVNVPHSVSASQFPFQSISFAAPPNNNAALQLNSYYAYKRQYKDQKKASKLVMKQQKKSAKLAYKEAKRSARVQLEEVRYAQASQFLANSQMINSSHYNSQIRSAPVLQSTFQTVPPQQPMAPASALRSNVNPIPFQFTPINHSHVSPPPQMRDPSSPLMK
eukprot:TRINITY_DN303_c0_g4_i1.p1 TRINITY_DN303_c0_g4~~TRINITY_DN303_c0_g4_i1.p1  ORF type:complete len:184 (+),score=102.82 TRINITY_DN303_c0_g4_i1:103-654(+)